MKSADGDVFEHLLYSDGLASIYRFTSKRGMKGYDGSRLEVIGSVHVYTGLLADRQITVVGEVPVATVEFVGRSLRRTPGPAAAQLTDVSGLASGKPATVLAVEPGRVIVRFDSVAHVPTAACRPRVAGRRVFTPVCQPTKAILDLTATKKLASGSASSRWVLTPGELARIRTAPCTDCP